MTDPQPETRLWGISAMSKEPTTYRGLEIPDWFEVAYATEADGLTVAIRVRINPETGPVAVGVSVLENPPRATYRDAVALLKGAPLDDLLHDAVLMAARTWAWHKGGIELGVPTDRALSEEQTRALGERVAAAHEQGNQVPRPQRRRSTTPGLLREAVKVYREAVAQGHPPTVAVSEHFSVSHRTAARWVAQARREGFLGPARGTKAGEVPPAEEAPTPSE